MSAVSDRYGADPGDDEPTHVYQPSCPCPDCTHRRHGIEGIALARQAKAAAKAAHQPEPKGSLKR